MIENENKLIQVSTTLDILAKKKNEYNAWKNFYKLGDLKIMNIFGFE